MASRRRPRVVTDLDRNQFHGEVPDRLRSLDFPQEQEIAQEHEVRKRGQQKIDPARAREIQEALIREHYMEGIASGTWDAKSQSAMQRFQADNGWQSKVVPDSRALIKMGLGPDHEHLLNPESAMTSQPAISSRARRRMLKPQSASPSRQSSVIGNPAAGK